MFGKIFSIEEFATFDGPGIRTTVFLKGCPLHCLWCHNPEGQSFETEYKRNPNGCVRCGNCLNNAKTTENRAIFTEESVKACPNNLIKPCGEEISADALCERLLKNAAILNASGGGVTFSGGEPTAQPDFILDCLKKLNGKVNRALQTSGFCAPEVFKRIIAECDYVLYDLKLIDGNNHKKFCGESNACILENYKTLAESGVPFITRVPLIPTITDTAENLSGIAEFMQGLGVKRAELLPYNKLTGSKYSQLNRDYKPDFDGEKAVYVGLDIFENYGITARVM